MTARMFATRRYPALPLISTTGTLLVVYPVLPDGLAGDAAVGVLMLALIVSGVLTLRGTGKHIVIASLLGAVGVGSHAIFATLTHQADAPRAELVSACTSVPFFTYVAWHSLRYASKHARLTDDRLLAAASAYLLLGLAWSGVHAFFTLIDSSSYASPGGSELDWGELIYFSYITLTTLGYGDVTPRTEPAQAAATIEAISGVFFLGFLVARMLAIPQGDEAARTVSDHPSEVTP
jgi:voltage-gated potassium channel Kch